MNSTLALPVHDPSQAGAARRAAAEWSAGLGLDTELDGRLALVVTELARNLALHTTQGGTLLLRCVLRAAVAGVEVLSLDRGPGMINFQRCLQDGFSTAGTKGIGLGTVRRASQSFAVHSQAELGTVLCCELWPRGQMPRPGGRWALGAINLPVPPEVVCGDAWAVHEIGPATLRIMVADGLGHGPAAAEAAGKASQIFAHHDRLDLVELMTRIDEGLRPTRGAAVGLAEVDFGRRQITWVGVGNVAGTVVTAEKTSALVSVNGTAGLQCRSLRSYTSAWVPGSSLVIASDGIKSQWNLKRYAGLLERTPGVIAGVLLRDFAREKDDVTVVVMQEQA